MEKKPKAVVLLSGGVDSATTLAIAKDEGFEPHTLSFNYGQRHAVELYAARKVAQSLGVEKHLVLNLDLHKIGGSALTGRTPVPKDNPAPEKAGGIPVTYVPARNTVFLAHALAWAEALYTGHIFIGVTAVDYSGYPDCRPEYIEAFEAMANLATKAGVEKTLRFKIHTPLIKLSKAEIIQKGKLLGVDYEKTLSCYDPTPEGLACGRCDSCILRKKGFVLAGIKDPTRYAGEKP